jgi:hypothetical protein
MYAKSLPLDIASRVWDVYFRDGEDFLFHTALGTILYYLTIYFSGILSMYETRLMCMEFDACVQFLTSLPQQEMDGDILFAHIARIQQQSSNNHLRIGEKVKTSFTQILNDVINRHATTTATSMNGKLSTITIIIII